MKRALVIAAILAPSVMFGQGYLNFSTFATADTANKAPAINVPVYVDVVGGATKVGADYYAAIFAGPVGTAESALVQATLGGTNNFKTFNASGTGMGLVKGGGNVMINVPVGAQAVVQVRAWSVSLGTDYSAAYTAWQAGNGKLGVSGLVTLTTAAGSSPTPRLANNGDPAYAALSATPGLASFAVVGVPEPSVVALAGLGLVGAFMIRRRK